LRKSESERAKERKNERDRACLVSERESRIARERAR